MFLLSWFVVFIIVDVFGVVSILTMVVVGVFEVEVVLVVSVVSIVVGGVVFVVSTHVVAAVVVLAMVVNIVSNCSLLRLMVSSSLLPLLLFMLFS